MPNKTCKGPDTENQPQEIYLQEIIHWYSLFKILSKSKLSSVSIHVLFCGNRVNLQRDLTFE